MFGLHEMDLGHISTQLDSTFEIYVANRSKGTPRFEISPPPEIARNCVPKDANQNRANQKNPFHEAFWKSRSIEPGKVETVFHGTSKEAAQSILTKGFNSSKDGLLGAGVYVTTDESALQQGICG